MKNIKEKILEIIDDKTIKKTLDQELNSIGSYYIDETGKIICKIDKLKLFEMFKNQSEYRLNLPTPFLLNLQVALNYKKCNKKIIDVEYLIEDCVFDKPFIIDSYCDMTFKSCNFSEGLTVKRCRNIKLNGHFIVSSNFFVEAQQIDFWNSFFMYHVKNDSIGTLSVKEININNLCLFSSNNHVQINSDIINMQSSNLSVGILELNAKKIIENNNNIKTTKKLIINDENNDELKNIESDVIIYNGMDISNSDKIMFPKLRHKLIETLKIIRRNIRADIQNDVNKHNEILENSSIKTFLKK